MSKSKNSMAGFGRAVAQKLIIALIWSSSLVLIVVFLYALHAIRTITTPDPANNQNQSALTMSPNND